jgi:hypothetical protein
MRTDRRSQPGLENREAPENPPNAIPRGCCLAEFRIGEAVLANLSYVQSEPQWIQPHDR